MKRHPTVLEAKIQIQELQNFIQMVEAYNPQNLRQQIIKMYAQTFSIKKVTETLNSERPNHLVQIESSFVRDIIKAKSPNDPLHSFVRKIYLEKTKHLRKKESSIRYW